MLICRLQKFIRDECVLQNIQTGSTACWSPGNAGASRMRFNLTFGSNTAVNPVHAGSIIANRRAFTDGIHP